MPAAVEHALRTLKSARATNYVGWGGLALVLAGFVLINEGSNFPGFVALVPTIGTLAILVSIARWWSWSSLVPLQTTDGSDRQVVLLDLPLALAIDCAWKKLCQPHGMVDSDGQH